MLILPLFVAYLLDIRLADPENWPHPVRWFGWLIYWGDKALNQGKYRFIKGMWLTIILVSITFVTFYFLDRLLWQHNYLGWFVFNTLFIFWGLANQSLVREARQVFLRLRVGLNEARQQLARIVGRDTQQLNAQQIRIAALETMAENLSDGVIAPLFYYACLGVPGMMTYKMINTMDSMIGYRNERYEQFGKFAARLDDVANFLPARLTVLLLALASLNSRALKYAIEYGHCHKSPNAGYPEAAVAGILNCRFGGPNFYKGHLVEKPYIGHSDRLLDEQDFTKAARLNHRSTFILIFTIIVMYLLFKEVGFLDQRLEQPLTLATAKSRSVSILIF